MNVDSSDRSLEADAWALLALKLPSDSIHASPGGAATIAWDCSSSAIPLARLEGRDFDYIMRTSRVTVGRNSRLGDVDVNMGSSSFVSRRHVEISYSNGRFYLLCLGRNGVFVNGMLHRDKSGPIELPRTCSIRFPSTQLRVGFSSLIDEDNPPDCDEYSNGDASEGEMRRLAVIGAPSSPHDRKSPCHSPTMTISAANSCPVSPRGSFFSPNPTDLQLAAYRAAQAVGQNNETELENLASAAALVQQSVVNGKSQSSNGLSKSSKPPFSYAQMIVQAITSARDKQLTLSGIYDYIVQNYPFYKRSEKGWQNSIRHNLSLNRYFVKVPRAQDGPGKGSYWRIDPAFESRLVDQAFRRRRQKGLPAFRPGLATRSAPSSPTRSMFMSPYHLQPTNTFIHRLPNPITMPSSHLTVPVPHFFSDSAPSSPLTPRSTTPRHSPMLSQSPSPSHSAQGSAFIIPPTTVSASNSSHITIQVPSVASLSQRNSLSPCSSPTPSGEHIVSRPPPPLLIMSQEHMIPMSCEQQSAQFGLSSPLQMVAKMTDSAQSALQVMSRVAGTVSPTLLDRKASYTAEYSKASDFHVATNADEQIGLVGENQAKRVKFSDL